MGLCNDAGRRTGKTIDSPEAEAIQKNQGVCTYKKISNFNANHGRKGVVFWEYLPSWQRFCTTVGHDGRALGLDGPMV